MSVKTGEGIFLDLGESVFSEIGVERSGLPSLLLLDSAPRRQCRSQRPFCFRISGSVPPRDNTRTSFLFQICDNTN